MDRSWAIILVAVERLSAEGALGPQLSPEIGAAVRRFTDADWRRVDEKMARPNPTPRHPPGKAGVAVVHRGERVIPARWGPFG